MFSFARHSKSKISNWWWTVDKVSFSLAVFLIFIGAMLVLSASPSAAHRDRLADDFAFIKKQGVFIFMGLVLMIGVSMQSLRTIRRLAVFGFLCAFAGVVLTYVVGDATKGAARWIKFAGFSLQPSEFIKPVFIVVTAWLLDANKRIEDFPGMTLAVGVRTAGFGHDGADFRRMGAADGLGRNSGMADYDAVFGRAGTGYGVVFLSGTRARPYRPFSGIRE